jgi:hypothetical protein
MQLIEDDAVRIEAVLGVRIRRDDFVCAHGRCPLAELQGEAPQLVDCQNESLYHAEYAEKYSPLRLCNKSGCLWLCRRYYPTPSPSEAGRLRTGYLFK